MKNSFSALETLQAAGGKFHIASLVIPSDAPRSKSMFSGGSELLAA